MKRVVLFYEHIVREYSAMQSIAFWLNKMSKETIEVEIRQYEREWGVAIRNANAKGVDAVVLPYLYADIPDYIGAIPFREINPNCLVANMHHEQIAAPYNDAFQLPHGVFAVNGCVHFAWGSSYAERLRQAGVSDELIAISGNVRLDPLVGKGVLLSKKQLADRYSLDENKIWILYCENRQTFDMPPKARKSHPILGNIDDEIYAAFRANEKESLTLTSKQINKLPASFFDKFELIYRPHPGTKLDIRLRKDVRIIEELPVHVWIKASGLVMVWNSTTALEANAFGVPVVRHEPVENLNYFRAYGLENFPVIHDLSSLSEESVVVYGEAQRDKEYFLPFYGEIDGMAAKRIAKKILEYIDQPPELIKVEENKSIKTGIVKRKARESVGNAICKLGIMDFLKWPKSIYYHKDELV